MGRNAAHLLEEVCGQPGALEAPKSTISGRPRNTALKTHGVNVSNWICLNWEAVAPDVLRIAGLPSALGEAPNTQMSSKT